MPEAGFARFLRAYRAQMGLGQRGLAELLEVSQQTISLWEKGRRTPGPRTWGHLERHLGRSRAEMQSGELGSLPGSGVRQGASYAPSLPLPPHPEGVPAMRLSPTGLTQEALGTVEAQRVLREALRAGRPVWIVVGER